MKTKVSTDFQKSCESFFCCTGINLSECKSGLRGEAIFRNVPRRFFIKVLNGSFNMDVPEQLVQVGMRVRQFDGCIAHGTAEIIGCLPRESALIMEYIPGCNLEQILRRTLWGVRAWSDPPFRRVAEVLASLNRIHAEDVGIEAHGRTNGSFRHKLESLWKESAVARWLPPRYRDMSELYKLLASNWQNHVLCRLLLADSQPKNVIVSPEGAKFIDLDFGFGHPSLEVAGFLLGLDRLAFRAPMPHQRKLVRHWKHMFLEAYLGVCESKEMILEDLFFFYPWVLLSGWEQHCTYWPGMKPGLAMFYGLRLRRFLCALQTARNTGKNILDCPTW